MELKKHNPGNISTSTGLSRGKSQIKSLRGLSADPTKFSKSKFPEKYSLNKHSNTDELPKETLNIFQTTCYLKTQNFRFKAFALKFEDGFVHFTKEDKNTGEFTTVYQNNFMQAHVRLGTKERCSRSQLIFYSVVLVLPGSKTRAIYFETIEL